MYEMFYLLQSDIWLQQLHITYLPETLVDSDRYHLTYKSV